MSVPYEVVAAPYTIYLATVGTAFPDVDTTPGASWTKLGTSGDLNYSDSGVTITHEQELNTFTPVGSTLPTKVWRVTEGFSIAFELADLSAEMYAKILNDATVTTTAPGAGTPGTKDFSLIQGGDVSLFAMLARGISPVDDSLAAQYQAPLCYQAENPAPVGKKGEPQILACSFVALRPATASVADMKAVWQTAAAS